MIETRRGKLERVLFEREGIQAFVVEIEGQEQKCLAYTDLCGSLKPGDEVLLNTTAISLGLGTGGYHYVISRIEPEVLDMQGAGHIMKLRYTPMQLQVLAVEEQDSVHHEQLKQLDSLGNCPVLVTTLHSMLAPLCLMLARYDLRVAYVMTDGAALPMVFSRTVDWLQKHAYLSGTVTTGHSFGGDLEAVNVYSGMLAAREVLEADVIIVGMGPGIVGTGTRWGYTGIEQGDILNAVDTLQGQPIAVPRISFGDARERHQGISHHTLTVLDRVCRVPAIVPLPFLPEHRLQPIMKQIEDKDLLSRYRFCMEEGADILPLLRDCQLKVTTMGRGIDEDPEFFLTLGASAVAAALLAQGESPHYLMRV